MELSNFSYLSVPVTNVKTGETYGLCSLNGCFIVSDSHAADVAQYCNEPTIYGVCFAQRYNGRPYTVDDAWDFLEWVQECWESESYFVFGLISSNGHLVGTIDLKSPNRRSAEIGYLLSRDHSGVMTNAVKAVVEIARQNGYQELYGDVLPENVRSTNVLLRAGFREIAPIIREGEPHLRFSYCL